MFLNGTWYNFCGKDFLIGETISWKLRMKLGKYIRSDILVNYHNNLPLLKIITVNDELI